MGTGNIDIDAYPAGMRCRLPHPEVSELFAKAQRLQDQLLIARAIYKARRVRDIFFTPGLFGEPGWDILLDLYAAHLEGRRITVGSACLASAVPQTTALRYVERMTQRGILVRSRCEEDARRIYLSLSEDAATKMSIMLAKFQVLMYR